VGTVVAIGTLDTKGAEYAFLRDRLIEHGADVILVDAGVQGEPTIEADVSRQEVARAAEADVEELATAGDRGAAVETMARGAAAIVERLYEQGRLDGVVGMGGTGGTSLVTHGMQRLPVGAPKLMVSTVGSGDTRPYVGAVDIAMMYSVVDIAGVNQISARIIGNAAAAIAGMASASMFGVTTPCVTTARERLEELGYEVLVFTRPARAASRWRSWCGLGSSWACSTSPRPSSATSSSAASWRRTPSDWRSRAARSTW